MNLLLSQEHLHEYCIHLTDAFFKWPLKHTKEHKERMIFTVYKRFLLFSPLQRCLASWATSHCTESLDWFIVEGQKCQLGSSCTCTYPLIHCPSASECIHEKDLCSFLCGVLSGDLTAQFACTEPIMSSYPEPMLACYLNARLDPLSYLFNPSIKLVCLYKPINLFTNIKLSRRVKAGL